MNGTASEGAPVERPYVVTGHWPFPVDMLRKDCSRPAGDEDRAVVERLSRPHADDDSFFDDVEITLIGPEAPNTARWESFGWMVPGDLEHAESKERRRRLLREKAVFASAMAKLDPEESELILSKIRQGGSSH